MLEIRFIVWEYFVSFYIMAITLYISLSILQRREEEIKTQFNYIADALVMSSRDIKEVMN